MPGKEALRDTCFAKQLPPTMMGHDVRIKLEMNPNGPCELSFSVANTVSGFFFASRDLPKVLRPCVHLTHKGDAVRLYHASTIRRTADWVPRGLSHNVSQSSDGSQGLGRAASRYMTGVAAYNRAHSPPPAPVFTRSLRCMRPSSAMETPRSRSTPRSSRTQRTRRAAAPEILSVRSPEKQQMMLRLTDESGAEDVSDPVVDGGGELISPQQLALTRPLDDACANCRKSSRFNDTPWCVKCNPRRVDEATVFYD